MLIKPQSNKIGINPICRGLIWAALPGRDFTYELINGGAAVLGSAASIDGRSPHGYSHTTTDATNGGIHYPFSELLRTIADKCTIIVWCNTAVLGGWSTLFSVPYTNSGWADPYNILTLKQESNTSNLYFGFADTGNVGRTVSSDTGGIQFTDGFTQYAVTRDGTTVKFYRNGKQHGASKTISANNIGWQNRNISLANRSSYSPGEGLQGGIPQSLVFNRALDETEISLLFAFPYFWTLDTNEPLEEFIPSSVQDATGNTSGPSQTIDGSAELLYQANGNALVSAQQIDGNATISKAFSGNISQQSQQVDGNASIVKPANGNISNAAQQIDGNATIVFPINGNLNNQAQQIDANALLNLKINPNISNKSQQIAASVTVNFGFSVSGDLDNQAQQIDGLATIIKNIVGNLSNASQQIDANASIVKPFSGNLINTAQRIAGSFINGAGFFSTGHLSNSAQTLAASVKISYNAFGSTSNKSQTAHANSNLIFQVLGHLIASSQTLHANATISFLVNGHSIASIQQIDGNFDLLNIRQFTAAILNKSQIVDGAFSISYSANGNVLNKSQTINGDILNGTFPVSPDGFLNYSQAIDEIFAQFNFFWLSNANSVLAYIPEIRWQGVQLPANPNTENFYVRVSQSTVTEIQASFTDLNSKKRFTVSGLVSVEIFCPKNNSENMAAGRELAIIAKNAFRGHSTTGRVWFRNASIKELLPNEKYNRLAVVAEYEYDELR